MVIGNSTTNNTTVGNAKVVLQIHDVSIKADSAFVCHSSSISLLLEGINLLTSVSDHSTGLGCLQISNIRIESIGNEQQPTQSPYAGRFKPWPGP
jgi:hypothetical protein